MYARDHVRPNLHGIDVEKLEKLYSELRRESMVSFFLIDFLIMILRL